MESCAVVSVVAELWARALKYFFPHAEIDAGVIEEQFRRNLHAHGNTFFRYPAGWDADSIAKEETAMYEMHCIAATSMLEEVLGVELAAELIDAMTHTCSKDCKSCGCPPNKSGGCGSPTPCCCKKGFPKPLNLGAAFVDEDGWYCPTRLEERDRWMEPTSPWLWAYMRTHLSFRRQNVLGIMRCRLQDLP